MAGCLISGGPFRGCKFKDNMTKITITQRGKNKKAIHSRLKDDFFLLSHF